MMPDDQRPRKNTFQLAQQGKQRRFLFQRSGIGRTAFGIQPTFVADADGVPVVIQAMRTYLFRRTTAVYLTVARQVEMIADVTEAAVPDVVTAAILKAQAHALRRGRAMDDEKSNRAHGYLQAPRPKAPAMAVATVMITLRTMPHTDFDFRSSLIMIRN